MTAFNKYLNRAMHLDDKLVSYPAKALHSTLGYGDRLLGRSASKLDAHLASSKAAFKVGGNPTRANEYLEKVKTLRDSAAAASHKTRVKTGLAVGAAGLVHKLNSGYNANTYGTSPEYQYQY